MGAYFRPAFFLPFDIKPIIIEPITEESIIDIRVYCITNEGSIVTSEKLIGISIFPVVSGSSTWEKTFFIISIKKVLKLNKTGAPNPIAAKIKIT